MGICGEYVGVLVGDVDKGSGGGVLEEARARRDVLSVDGEGLVIFVFADDDVDAFVAVAASVTGGIY